MLTIYVVHIKVRGESVRIRGSPVLQGSWRNFQVQVFWEASFALLFFLFTVYLSARTRFNVRLLCLRRLLLPKFGHFHVLYRQTKFFNSLLFGLPSRQLLSLFLLEFLESFQFFTLEGIGVHSNIKGDCLFLQLFLLFLLLLLVLPQFILHLLKFLLLLRILQFLLIYLL